MNYILSHHPNDVKKVYEEDMEAGRARTVMKTRKAKTVTYRKPSWMSINLPKPYVLYCTVLR